MIYNWIHRNDGANSLIVFFNGWGLGNEIVEHLDCNLSTDILVVSDYRNLKLELPNLSSYQQRTLIAWSFGVANFLAWQQNQTDIFETKIAINGTAQGVNRHHGIPERVVQHTIDTLCEESYLEFRRRCFNSNEPLSVDLKKPVDIQALQLELQAIKDRKFQDHSSVIWDTVWISQDDNIFPTKNQQRAWKNHPYKLIDAAHAPFTMWTHWQQLFNQN